MSPYHTQKCSWIGWVTISRCLLDAGGGCWANWLLPPGPSLGPRGSFAGIAAGRWIAASEPAGNTLSVCSLLYPIKCFKCFPPRPAPPLSPCFLTDGIEGLLPFFFPRVFFRLSLPLIMSRAMPLTADCWLLRQQAFCLSRNWSFTRLPNNLFLLPPAPSPHPTSSGCSILLPEASGMGT